MTPKIEEGDQRNENRPRLARALPRRFKRHAVRRRAVRACASGRQAACFQAACFQAVRCQAACCNTFNGSSRTLRACSSSEPAMSRQLPQLAPAPVRMVSSGRLRQPASAAWRMSRSVTPLQMQTYTAQVFGQAANWLQRHSAMDANDCQLTAPNKRIECRDERPSSRSGTSPRKAAKPGSTHPGVGPAPAQPPDSDPLPRTGAPPPTARARPGDGPHPPRASRRRASGPGTGTACGPAICRANGARWRNALA